MVGDGDSAASALVLADGEVLAESAGALNGRLVDLGVLADLVGRAVAGDAADGLGAADGARVVAVVLDDVVLCTKSQPSVILTLKRHLETLPVNGELTQPYTARYEPWLVE